MKRTKVAILQARYKDLRDESGKISRALNSAQTSAAPVPLCSTCGAEFRTAFDFDNHYLVDDERFLNLGNCPTRYNAGKLMPLLHNPWSTKDLWDEAHELNRTKDLLQAKGTPITLEDYNKLTQVVDDREWCSVYGYEVPETHTCIVGVCYEPHKDEKVPLTRHVCTECGDLFDEEKATICNKCDLAGRARDDMRY